MTTALLINYYYYALVLVCNVLMCIFCIYTNETHHNAGLLCRCHLLPEPV